MEHIYVVETILRMKCNYSYISPLPYNDKY